jgi:hypothetical protein
MNALRGFFSGLMEKARAEGEKLKPMRFREKLDYIWEYYKIQIIIAVVVLIFIGTGVYNTWINPPKAVVLSLAWLAGYEHTENLDALSARLIEILTDDPERQTVEIAMFADTGNPEYDVAMQQRFIAMLAARDIDIIIATREDVQILAEAEIAADLSEFPIERDAMVYYEYGDGSRLAAAALVAGYNGIFETSYADDLYAVVPGNARNTEAVRRLFEALWGEQ